MQCFVCRNKKLIKFLSLGKQPPSDAFLRKKDFKKPEKSYPLDLYFCQSCGLVQLGYIVRPEVLFRDYVYTTSSNNSLKANFKSLAEILIKRFKLGRQDLAVDIGSNDGTLLSYYAPAGVKVLGIDPSSSTKLALDQGIPTVVDFFSAKVAKKVVKEYGQAKVITATNVFAHVVDLDDFMAGITHLLSKEGVFISESNYLLDFIQKLQYDSIYHEHLRYYSLKPLQILFDRFGMEIIDVERVTTHGGSIRVYAARKGAHSTSKYVEELMTLEKERGMYKKKIYFDFAKRVEKNKLDLCKLIKKLKADGKHIVGIGAPAKGNTLLNYCDLNSKYIDYLVEKSSIKIGTFTPGLHLPVVEEEVLFEDQPDYGLLLSWNIADELIPKIRNKGYRGKFIIPTPKPLIV